MGLGMHLQSSGIIDDLKQKAVAAEAGGHHTIE
jgi:hypothetical protein